jgi:hypothetical protein
VGKLHAPAAPAPAHTQAFERQVDSLSRQLAKGEGDAEEVARERDVLREELRAAQQVGALVQVDCGTAG